MVETDPKELILGIYLWEFSNWSSIVPHFLASASLPAIQQRYTIPTSNHHFWVSITCWSLQLSFNFHVRCLILYIIWEHCNILGTTALDAIIFESRASEILWSYFLYTLKVISVMKLVPFYKLVFQLIFSVKSSFFFSWCFLPTGLIHLSVALRMIFTLSLLSGLNANSC